MDKEKAVPCTVFIFLVLLNGTKKAIPAFPFFLLPLNPFSRRPQMNQPGLLTSFQASPFARYAIF